MKKLLNNLHIIFLITAAAVLYGCSDNKESDYLAKVGDDSYLTPNELSRFIDTSAAGKDLTNTYIHNWVEQEILYLEAVNQKITEDEKYKSILENSKKRLAGVLLLNKIRDEKLTYSETELEKFYNQHQNEFRFTSDNYLLNIIHFNDEDKAIEFRTKVLESNWSNALNSIKAENSVILNETNKLYPVYHLNPLIISNVTNILLPQEVSIVLKLDEKRYVVMQLLQKYLNNDLPSFDLVKDEVKKKLEAKLLDEKINSYLKSLFSKYETDIKEIK